MGWADGHILRASPSGVDWREVRPADGRRLSTPIVLPGNAGLIAVGWEDGHILLIGDKWSEKLRLQKVADGFSGDNALKEFTSTIPIEILAQTEVGAVVQTLPTIWAQRDLIAATRDDARVKRNAIDVQPARKLDLQDLLAQNIPPGILLLFLLATFSSLYRYNLRLAGFHHSRADALELAMSGEHLNPDVLDRYAQTLAADRVEFAQASTPSAQAMELAKGCGEPGGQGVGRGV